MKRFEIAGLSLVLGGMILLAGCSFQFQTKRGEEATGEVIEASDTAVTEEDTATSHAVVKGETLWDIAGYDDIYGDPTKWKRIYEANKDILSSPDSLKPGQVLIIPRG